MRKFLYGASVQGIQGFIFQTNELKHIIGASEIVERVCTTYFTDRFQQGGEMIVEAAGNVKCLYTDREECERTVKYFPKTIVEHAPGITISQAVVVFDDDNFGKAVEELERRLRAQRNRPMPSLTTGLMAVERSRKTGLPAVNIEENDFIDESTKLKIKASKEYTEEGDRNATFKLCKKSFGENVKELDFKNVAFDIEDLTEMNDWIAIIHADGNGLGQIVSSIGKQQGKLKKFSSDLDHAVEKAAQLAFEKLNADFDLLKAKIPLRPVVLSGDDMTIICRGDLAIPYAKWFMQYFEEETEKMGHPLTACAGIAYIKSSYPFYYGYNLAETLCGIAKKDAKKRVHDGKVPACLAFHKVQSSFVEDYDEILAKEKTPQDGHSLEFGPYYLHEMEGRWTIDELQQQAGKLKGKEGNATKSSLRQWMTILHDGVEQAEQRKERMLTIVPKSLETLVKIALRGEEREGKKCYPVQDILTLHTINTQQTK